MPTVLMTDPATGHCAFYDEAPGGGAFDDVNAPRNRPLKDPTNWLANLYFHTALDNLEVHSDSTVTVAHEAVGTKEETDFVVISSQVDWNAYTKDRLLVTHNLGYVPDFIVARGNGVLMPAMPVQTQSGGRARYATVYANETQIRMFERVSLSGSSLAATSLSYQVLIFRNPPARSGSRPDFDADGLTGHVEMGNGRFDSSRRYLQVVPGGSPLGIFYGKSIDASNGAPCFARPNTTPYEPVPASTTIRKTPPDDSDPGESLAYDGSFTGSEVIQVQAP